MLFRSALAEPWSLTANNCLSLVCLMCAFNVCLFLLLSFTFGFFIPILHSASHVSVSQGSLLKIILMSKPMCDHVSTESRIYTLDSYPEHFFPG